MDRDNKENFPVENMMNFSADSLATPKKPDSDDIKLDEKVLGDSSKLNLTFHSEDAVDCRPSLGPALVAESSMESQDHENANTPLVEGKCARPSPYADQDSFILFFFQHCI